MKGSRRSEDGEAGDESSTDGLIFYGLLEKGSSLHTTFGVDLVVVLL